MSDDKKPTPGLTAPRFKPGQSGNPGGKVVGTRNKLTAKFLHTLAADFDEHGAKAIKECRETNPAAYVKAIAALLPKEVEIKRPLEDFEDDELITAVRALQSYLATDADAEGASDAAKLSQAH